MNGGKITGNTATEKDGDIYVKTGGTFTQGGAVSGIMPDVVYEEP